MVSNREVTQQKLFQELVEGGNLYKKKKSPQALEKYSSVLEYVLSSGAKPPPDEVQGAISSVYLQIGRDYLEFWDNLSGTDISLSKKYLLAAEYHLRQALRFAPITQINTIKYFLATFFLRTKEWENAILYLEEIKSDLSWKERAYEALTTTYKSWGKELQARQDFSTGLAVYQKMEKQENVRMKFFALHYQGYVSSQQFSGRDFKYAVACYEKCIALYQENAAVLSKPEDKYYASTTAYNCALLIDEHAKELEFTPKGTDELLHLAASLDCAAAWYQLAVKYHKGDEVMQNLGVAIDFYQQALELEEYAPALTALGRIYCSVPEKLDLNKGLDYLKKAAEKKILWRSNYWALVIR